MRKHLGISAGLIFEHQTKSRQPHAASGLDCRQTADALELCGIGSLNIEGGLRFSITLQRTGWTSRFLSHADVGVSYGNRFDFDEICANAVMKR